MLPAGSLLWVILVRQVQKLRLLVPGPQKLWKGTQLLCFILFSLLQLLGHHKVGCCSFPTFCTPKTCLLSESRQLAAVHQAIYGFTGAQHDSLACFQKTFSATKFPLTITWRCPSSHVKLANDLLNLGEVMICWRALTPTTCSSSKCRPCMRWICEL